MLMIFILPSGRMMQQVMSDFFPLFLSVMLKTLVVRVCTSVVCFSFLDAFCLLSMRY
jgi:hypothetical protein